jgi:periplasmic nitrate reductase NapD
MSYPDVEGATTPEVHVAGVLVHARPETALAVGRTLSGMQGVEVHDVTPEGRLVVVCECTTDRAVFVLIERIREISGVIDTALVYQHAESAAAMEEEIADETDPPRLH